WSSLLTLSVDRRAEWHWRRRHLSGTIYPKRKESQMMNWDYAMNGWMGAWMWIPTILIIALLVLGLIAIVRGPAAEKQSATDDPLAIAARRLARGDISKDEYETLRSTLA